MITKNEMLELINKLATLAIEEDPVDMNREIQLDNGRWISIRTA